MAEASQGNGAASASATQQQNRTAFHTDPGQVSPATQRSFMPEMPASPPPRAGLSEENLRDWIAAAHSEIANLRSGMEELVRRHNALLGDVEQSIYDHLHLDDHLHTWDLCDLGQDKSLDSLVLWFLGVFQ